RLARGPLALADAVRVGSQIAAGLAAAHRHGIVHCDLKPGNVMLTSDGHVKLVDFGIARRWRRTGDGRLEGPIELHGTPGYMSPEQARGEHVDPAADAWAFGCVLLECLSGR